VTTDPPPGPAPEASLVVPCRNAAEHIGGLCDSLLHQDFERPWEVILVDNGSRDRSIDVAQRILPPSRLSVLRAASRANASYARNTGARAARSTKLLFADADDELDPAYVRTMAYALDTHDYVTSAADSAALNPDWVRDAYGEPWAGGAPLFFGFMPATGINIGIRRSVFESLGGFPEEYSGSQDIAFSWRAQLAGCDIHFVPEAVYRYRYRTSPWGLFQQSRNWGYSGALLYRQFRPAGMPGRTRRTASADWLAALSSLARARTKPTRAAAATQVGFALGRLQGSVRYRVFYL
jgi:glycosyltransferase involved in cell wall biosynthesis